MDRQVGMVMWNNRQNRKDDVRASCGSPAAGRSAPLRWVVLLSCACGWGSAGCDQSALEPKGDAGAGPAGLTPAQAAAVVARVGDRTITLGDYAATLERMNQYDRLRYQTKDQRRKLLQEMIDNELLAQEAERRGLDQQEQVQHAIRQILRDAMLAQARQGLPAAAELPKSEVRAYYEQHKDQFEEPERRRVSAIVLEDRDKAEQVLEEARSVDSGEAWGELFHKHSVTAPKKRNPAAPADLAGDLGIVGPVGDRRGANRKVPEPVQRAIFLLKDVGDVHGVLIEAERKFYIVRLSGRTAGHTRSFAEAERSIRVRLLQERVRQQEEELIADLRKRFRVVTDDEALGAVKLPEGWDRHVPTRSGAPPPATGDPPQGAPSAETDAGP